MGNDERAAGTKILIEVRIVQRTPKAVCVVQGDDPEQAAWLWARDFELVAELPDDRARLRVDAALAAQRGLVGLDP